VSNEYRVDVHRLEILAIVPALPEFSTSRLSGSRGLRPHRLTVPDDRKTFSQHSELNAYQFWPGFARIQNVFVQNGPFSTETA
jgi:hypothetical protein